MRVHAQIKAGVCGFETSVAAECSDGMTVSLSIESTCPKLRALAMALDAFDEVLRRPLIETTPAQLAAEHGLHATCLVPIGLLKAAEAAAGLALPATSTIELVKDD